MNRRLHVLSLIDELYYVGGGENRLLSLAQAVDGSRFDHTVATLRRERGGDDADFSALLAKGGIVVRNLGFESGTVKGRRSRISAALMFARKVREVSRLIQELDIDVVDAHLDPAILIGVLSGLATRARTVVTVYEAKPFPRSARASLRRWLTLRLADVVITDSQARRADIQRFVAHSEKKIRVIPNGIPAPQPRRPQEEVRRALAMPTSPATKVIGQISRLVPFKGQGILLDAAQVVLREYPDAFFLLVGYAPDLSYHEALIKKAATLGISARVHIAEYAGAIGDVWQLVDVHVHASLLDSLPNAIIEGMALGKPAIVTAVGGIPEAVEDGRTGLIVPPGDPQTLAAAVLQLLRNPDLAMALGNAARKRYAERYRAEVMSAKIEECFQDVMR